MKNVKNRIELIVFDLDGTLLDSKIDVSSSINNTLNKYGLDSIESDLIWTFLGDGAAYLIDRCFAYRKSNVPDTAKDFFLDDYRNNCLVHTKLYAHVLDVIKSLSGFKKVIFTNKRQKITEFICAELNITSLFDYILGRGRFNKKPDPEGLLYILSILKISPSNAVIVGDTTVDLLCGERAKTKRIAVTWGVHSKEVLQKANPDAIIDDIRELPSVVKGDA